MTPKNDDKLPCEDHRKTFFWSMTTLVTVVLASFGYTAYCSTQSLTRDIELTKSLQVAKDETGRGVLIMTKEVSSSLSEIKERLARIEAKMQ